MNKYLLFLLVIIVLAPATYAQNIVLTTEAPAVVRVGQQFRVTWTANSRGGSLEAPQFNDFYKLMGPQSSFSQQTSIVQGKVTQIIKNSFTYYLKATKEGTFTLGRAKYIEKNKEYFSREITIEVLPSETDANQNQAGQNQSDELGASSAGDNVKTSDLYFRLLVNRNKVVMGEYIIATLKIYSRLSLSGLQEVKYPDFNGFLKSDLETEPLRSLEQENVGGQIYNTGVLQRFLLYPQKSGELEIDPASLTVLIQEQTRSNDPFFADFFSSFNTVPRVISTSPVKIQVSALPDGAPESFSGTVGSLTIKSTSSMDTMMVNDALTYRVEINGSGNLRLSSAPEIQLSPDIEVYEPKVIPSLKATVNGTIGKKVFEYVLIPRHHGQFEIPEVKYSYYDPDQKRYITLSTESHKFFVKKNDEENQDTRVFGSVTKEDITYLGKDIRYIQTGKIKLRKRTELMISRSSFFIIYLSVLLIFILVVIWRREHLKRNADLVKLKNRKAARIASLRLKQASKYLKEAKEEEFFAEILRTLWGYLSDKLGIPVSDLNISIVIKILSDRGLKESTLSLIKSTIEICEYSRYSPVGDQKSSKEIYSNAESVIKDIENEL